MKISGQFNLFSSIILILYGLQCNSQNVEWLKREHIQHAEEFKQMAFVASDTEPFIVLHLQHIANNGGGGGSGPTVTKFLYAYTSEGDLLWNYQCSNAPIAILSKDPDHYWLVTYGPAELPILNGTLSGTGQPNTSNLYFVEFDINGVVTNSFVWAIPTEAEFIINQVKFDINGDFIFTGRINPEGLLPVNFSFAGTSFNLDPYSWTHYVARASDIGEQMAITTFTGKRFGSNRGVITHLAQNEIDGSILVGGRLNDTLHFETASLVGVNNVYQDLCLIHFTENLEYIDSRSIQSSTYGSITRALEYNAQNNLFYITGSLGDQLYILDQNTPVQGNVGTVQNTYIASISGLDVTGGVYFIPADLQGFERIIVINDILFDNQNQLLVVANVHENGFWIGNTPVVIDAPFAIPDYEIVQITLNSLNFSIDDLAFSTGVGQVVSSQSCYDADTESLYIAGTFNGVLNYGSIQEFSSVAGFNDSYIIKQNLTPGVSTTIGQEMENVNVKLFPNPAITSIQIVVDEQVEYVRIYDAIGKRCLEISNTNQIDISSLIPGIYFAEVHCKGKQFQQRFVKL